MEIRQSAIDRTEGFESFVEYFYLDSNGNVTIGYGHLVANADDAISLSMNQQDNTAASARQIRNAWTTISGKDYPHVASYYKQFTTITLASDGSDLLKLDLTQAANDLKTRFADLDSYPDQAQDALLDMMFNIGLTRFSEGNWPNLFSAVRAKDWRTAATNCHRNGIPDSRNDSIKNLFLAAAQQAAHYALTALAALPLINEIARERMADVERLIALTGSADKLFPNGITKIHLNLTAFGVTVGIDIVGPPSVSETS